MIYRDHSGHELRIMRYRLMDRVLLNLKALIRKNK